MKPNTIMIYITTLLVLATSPVWAHGPANYDAAQVDIPPTIDGVLDEAAWQQAPVYPLDQLWLGNLNGLGDLGGSFRVLWSPEANRIYLAVTMQDDVVTDLTANPLQDWWTDDGVEVFLDPDHSGGIHQNNHQAFAYHISLFGDAIDLDVNGQPINLKKHITVALSDDQRTWEIAVQPIAEYNHRQPENQVEWKLEAGQVLGLAVAYNDNDGIKGLREAFLGSVAISGRDKNLAWVTADVFGDLHLLGQ